MAGEYLVVDNESPYPSTFTATDIDVNVEEKECEDGDHCKPPDSIFAKDQDNDEEIIVEEASIREEAEFTIIQQQIPTDEQQQQALLLLDDEFIAKNTKRQPPASSASAVTEQTPLVLQRKMVCSISIINLYNHTHNNNYYYSTRNKFGYDSYWLFILGCFLGATVDYL